MKKFKYRQASYLRYVEHLRNEAVNVARDAENVVEDIKEKMMKNEEKIKKSFQKNSEYGTNETSIFDVRDTNLFIQQVRQTNQNLNVELEAASQDYQEKLQKLIDLQQELKSLEKHKERKLDEHKKVERKKEQKKTDEINSLRYGERHG